MLYIKQAVVVVDVMDTQAELWLRLAIKQTSRVVVVVVEYLITELRIRVAIAIWCCAVSCNLSLSDYPEFSEAPNFVPQVGVWEVRNSGDVLHGMVNRQVVLSQPCDWCKNTIPVNIGGNYEW